MKENENKKMERYFMSMDQKKKLFTAAVLKKSKNGVQETFGNEEWGK